MPNYACTVCYVAAHDSSAPSPHIDPLDIQLTDWVCADHEEDSDTCSACEGTLTEFGVTVGGMCDLGNHAMTDYWEFHTFTR